MELDADATKVLCLSYFMRFCVTVSEALSAFEKRFFSFSHSGFFNLNRRPTKGKEISKAMFLETPLPKEQMNFLKDFCSNS